MMASLRQIRLSRRLLHFAPLLLFLLVSCARQPLPDSYYAPDIIEAFLHNTLFNPPGFLAGVIHGFTILWSFLLSVLCHVPFLDSLLPHVRIYAFPNAGSWYDFGYLLGVGMFYAEANAGIEKARG